jgi:hypothetical protein
MHARVLHYPLFPVRESSIQESFKKKRTAHRKCIPSPCHPSLVPAWFSKWVWSTASLGQCSVLVCWMNGLMDPRTKVEELSHWDATWGVRILIKKLQNPSVIRETNLLSLINLSLAYIYCSTTLSNHELIRLKKFVSQNSLNLCI